MTTQVAVLTDSAASLPDGALEGLPGSVVPLTVVVGEESFQEGPGISPAEVAAALDSGTPVTTSQPGPEAFAQAIAAVASEGATAVLIVTLSRTLSGAYDAAVGAAREADMVVEVVDSETVAMAQGLAALAAAHAAASGAALDECVQVARTTAGTAQCLFTVDSLEPLKRGGRLSPAAAALGAALSIRPLLAVEDGEVNVVAKTRTTRRARAAVAARAAAAASVAPEAGFVWMGAVVGLQAEAVAEVCDALAGLAPGLPLMAGPLSAVLAAHVGSGAVAACVAQVPAALGETLSAR